jgi:hypothetical protein
MKTQAKVRLFTQLRADDSADTSDGVTFSLADDSLGFSIDAATGVVTTNADFRSQLRRCPVTELYRGCY